MSVDVINEKDILLEYRDQLASDILENGFEEEDEVYDDPDPSDNF